MRKTRGTLLIAGFAAMAIAACDQGPATTGPEGTIAFDHTNDPPGQEGNGHIEVCKVGTDANFQMTVDGGTPSQFSVTAGTCVDAFVTPAPTSYVVVIEELASPNYSLVSIEKSVSLLGGVPTVTAETNPVTTDLNDDLAVKLTFTNQPVVVVPAEGRMTGGGNPMIDGVNLGFTLHCDITLSNNLEINWDGGNWHLDKPIDRAICTDDAAIDPTPPASPFDTFEGWAEGRLDGVPGSQAWWEFVDAGEPGRNDMVAIKVWAPAADPSTATPILDISGKLTRGNFQAHYDQPHGNRP